jgi:hypothetical protein
MKINELENTFESVKVALQLINNCNESIANEQAKDKASDLLIAQYESRRLQHFNDLLYLLGALGVPLQIAQNDYKQAA